MMNLHNFSATFSRLIPRVCLLPVVLAGMMLPAAAQVSYMGSAASQNFGSVAIGSPKAVSLPFSVAAGTTVGSIGVLTQGAANLDFTNGTATTCTATTYSSATNCTVSVTFTPKAAGVRMGAVVFFSGAGNTGTQLASVPVYGVGTGPQIAYGPGTQTIFDPTANGFGVDEPRGVATDAAGDLFIADSLQSRIVEVPAGGGAAIAIGPTVNGASLSYPYSVAVDGAGSIFISNFGSSNVVEVPFSGGAAIVIDPTVDGRSLSEPVGVAVDGAGDLFIADESNQRILKVPAGGGAAIVIAPSVNGESLG